MDVTFNNIVVEYGKTRVLHEVSGKAFRGQILAIIGPSGAGKTSLLNALAGRVKLKSGTVTIGNQKADKKLRRCIAYVTQEDVFFPNLTLKETLMFSAMLRLPDSMAYSKKLQRVETIVKQFDLSKCINTIMGDVTVRGLSGGERKRANIACEMINNVDVIIVDEPTSGLDSAIAYQVMNVLQAYTETEHKTAIVTLHQPSSRIFHMCADIMVLSSGKVAYNGPEKTMIEFLDNLGFQCPSYYNPAEFILENLRDGAESEDRIIQAALLAREQQSKILQGVPDDSQYENGKVNHAFVDGILCGAYPNSSVSIEVSEKGDVEPQKWNTGFLTQYKLLCKRHLKQMAGSYFSLVRVGTCAAVAILVGLLWYQIPHTSDKIQSRQGLIFFCQIYFGFAIKGSVVASYHMERTVIMREQAAGMYRISAYYLSKMTSEILLNMVQPFFFYTFVYWMAGLSDEPWIFICSLLIAMTSAITAAGIGMFFAIMLDDLGTCFEIASNYYITLMILGGFFVVNDTRWFHWTKYLSTLYFTTTASTKIEFLYGSGFELDTPESTNITTCSMETPAKSFESRLEESFPIWLDCVFILLYITFYWLAGYVMLRWLKKLRLSHI